MIVAPTDPERAVAAVEAYVAAFAAGDARAAANLYAPDGTVEDPVGAPVVSGAANIAAFYERAMGMGLRLERTGPVRVAGDSAAFPFRIHYPAGAERRTVEVIDTFRFDDHGRVIEMRAFWGPDTIDLSEKAQAHA